MKRPQLSSFSIYHIGVAAALVSIAFFFGAMILAFGFRVSEQGPGMRFDTPRLLWASTGVLMVSSAALEGARWALRRAFVVMYRGRLAGALALAFLFLLMQIASSWELWRQGVGASANPYGSAHYVFMTMHGAHLLFGVAWLAVLYRRSTMLFEASENDLRRHRVLAAAAALYWHFMGLLWLVLFGFLLAWSG